METVAETISSQVQRVSFDEGGCPGLSRSDEQFQLLKWRQSLSDANANANANANSQLESTVGFFFPLCCS